MDIGEHCDICGQLDFLPFKCYKCTQTLCGSHRMHDCKVEAPNAVVDQPPKWHTTQNQSSKSASKPATKPESQPQHGTKHVPPPKQKVKQTPERLASVPRGSKPNNERAIAALERFKQLVGVSSKPKPQNTLVSVDMRRSAVGDSSIAVANRAYFNVQRPPQPYTDPLTNKQATRPGTTGAMYFNKMHTAGQLLDRASKQLGIHGKGITCDNQNIELSTPISGLVQGSTLLVIL